MLAVSTYIVYNELTSQMMLLGLGGIALVGFVCNVLLLRVLYRINELWGSLAFRLITCVAAGDLLSSLAMLGTGIFRAALGYAGVLESEWYCRLFGSTMFLGNSLTGLLLSMLALDRYLAVRHSRRLKPTYAWLVFGASAVVSIVILGYSVHRNAFELDPTYSHCMPSKGDRFRWTSILMKILANVPVLIISFCYTAIFTICCRIQSANHALFGSHLPFRALFIFLAYLICYFPKLFVFIWSLFTDLYPPFILYILSPLAVTSLIVINPMLVLFLSNKVQQEVMHISFYQASDSSEIIIAP
ncbi:hypothetical protein DSO57_1035942 [Entomophthora muscae]|uniref:Uncharacterized protein n=1 Tax=Entomophthora muscae TaxID=34485 RepID=A0ACC2SNK7_9FUNG|nr:hypothetical protein DSO57_1035942 [Entomophthora muscae]